MADKAISELTAAEQIKSTDMFVLEQDGTAKRLQGQTLLNWLTAAADGHGGIKSIAKTGTDGLVDTYTITLADTTTMSFTVTNGNGLTKFEKTGTEGLVDTYRFARSDGTYFTFAVSNGAKGDTGDASYVWIKYASQHPTAASHSMGDVPDEWMGVYVGTEESAPDDWQDYTWYQIKGTKGDTGAPATVTGTAVEYVVSDSGTEPPSSEWDTTIPAVPQGKYLWTRVTTTFNSGDPILSYTVSRAGVDGSSPAAFDVDADGNLRLYYTGDTAPDYSINEEGHLILQLDEDTFVDLGLVRGPAGKDGKDGKDGTNGAPGAPGKDGADGAPGKDGADGAPGKDGTDGYSPTASVTESDTGATITITDKTGTTTVTVKNGKDGAPGKDGANGTDGKDGTNGKDGTDGKDGITPSIGANGNWYLGDTDTGEPSRGATGPQGPQGDTGPQGPHGPAGKDAVAGTGTVVLTASGWTDKAQTVSVSDVAADSTVIVSPAPASVPAYAAAQVYCSAQGAGTLTFVCDTAPTAALTVHVVILR